MADQGFTGYMSDFAGAIKENGADIMETTAGIEKLIKDALDRFTDDEKLDEMVTAIRTTLDTLLDSLENGGIFNTAALKAQFDEVVKQVGDSLHIDLNGPLDPENIIQTITDSIPEDAFPEELKHIYGKISGFLDNVDLSDVRLSVKTINAPVPKPSPPGNSTGAAALPSNFNVFAQTTAGTTTAPGAAAAADDLFDGVFKKTSDAFSSKKTLIAEILTKLETAMVRSGFYNDLEDKKEAFISAITAKDITISKIFHAVAELITGLIESTIYAIIDILEFLLDDLKRIISGVKDLLEPGSNSIVEAIFEQFGIQDILPDYKLSVLSLPAFLISVPLTLITKAVTGGKPTFPEITQGEKKDKISGSIQLCKTLPPILALGSYQLSKKEKTEGWAIFVGLVGDLLGLGFDFYEQFSDIPNDETKSGKAFLWGWKVPMNLAKTGIVVCKLVQDIGDLKKQETQIGDLKKQETQSTVESGVSYLWPALQNAIEISTTAISAVIYHSDDSKEKPAAYFWLDALPGILDGLLSIIRTNIDGKVEKIEDNNDDALLMKIKNGLNNLTNNEPIWNLELDGDNPIYIFYNEIPGVRASDFDVIMEKWRALKNVITEIIQYFSENNLPDNLKEKLKSIKQIQEKIEKGEPLINTPYEKNKNIKVVFNNFNNDLSAVKSELVKSKNNLEGQNKTKVTAAIKEQVRQLNEMSARVLVEIETLKNNIPLDDHTKHFYGLTLLLENKIVNEHAQFTDSSILGSSIAATESLQGLIKDENFKPTSDENKILLKKHTEELKDITTDPVFELNILPMPLLKELLKILPSPDELTRKTPYGPLKKQKQNLELIEYKLGEIRKNMEDLFQKKSTAEIKKLEKTRYILDGINIIFNTTARVYCGVTDLKS